VKHDQQQTLFVIEKLIHVVCNARTCTSDMHVSDRQCDMVMSYSLSDMCVA